MRVPWTARRSNKSILKEISPEYSLEGLMLKLKLQYFVNLCEELSRLTCSQVCGIFLDQGLNLYLLHWQADSSPLRHQGSPLFLILADQIGSQGIYKEGDLFSPAQSTLSEVGDKKHNLGHLVLVFITLKETICFLSLFMLLCCCCCC